MSNQAKKAKIIELMQSAAPAGPSAIEVLGLVAKALAHNAPASDPIVRQARKPLGSVVVSTATRKAIAPGLRLQATPRPPQTVLSMDCAGVFDGQATLT